MMEIAEGVPLSRFTTFGVGGPAAVLAQPESVPDIADALRHASNNGLPVETIGLGSNLLVADEGVEALVMKLAGDLTDVWLEGDDTLVAGGGATNAVCLHKAREAGLGGFEFAAAIPGTAGGGVRMNAGAYGSNWRSVLLDAVVVGPHGVRIVNADDMALSYRASNLLPGDVVARVRYRLTPKSPDEIKADVADLLTRRKASQPTNKRTFGSVFKNPPEGPGAGALIESCGLKGYRVGGAVISEQHANFIENAGGATCEDALALMREAMRRVRETHGVELEHEVRLLGSIKL